MAAKAIQNPGVADLLKNRLREHQRTRRSGELISDLVYPFTNSVLSSRLMPFGSSLLSGVGSFKATTDYILDNPYTSLQAQLQSSILARAELEAKLASVEEECASLRHLDKPTVDPDSIPHPELEERCAQLERMVNELQEQIRMIKEENERLMSRSVADEKEKEKENAVQSPTTDVGASWEKLGMLTPASSVSRSVNLEAPLDVPGQDTNVDDDGQATPSAEKKLTEVEVPDTKTSTPDSSPVESQPDNTQAEAERSQSEPPYVIDDPRTPTPGDAPTMTESLPDLPRPDSALGSVSDTGSGSGSGKKKQRQRHFDLHDFFSSKHHDVDGKDGDKERHVLHKRRRVFSTPSAPGSGTTTPDKEKNRESSALNPSTIPRRHSRFDSFVEPIERRASMVVKRGKELLRQDSSSSHHVELKERKSSEATSDESH